MSLQSVEPQATVIIPTLLSRPELLRACLVSLSKQTLTSFNTIIIANQTSSEQLSTFKNTCTDVPDSMNWLPQSKNTGFAKAVNIGIQNTSTPYLVLLNDDTEVTPEWLEQLMYTQQQTGSDMVASTIIKHQTTELDSQGFSFAWRGKAEAVDGGLISFKNDQDYWLKDSNKKLLDPQGEFKSDFWHEPFGPDAAACLYTRKLFETIGLFNESFFAYLEDVELALRARKAGFSCVVAEQAIVYHHKHATSSQKSGFKARQDMINWWRIVMNNYSVQTWIKYGVQILIERGRNTSGLLKAVI